MERIYRLFQLEIGERRLALAFLIHSFFLGITLTFADTAAYTVFLTRYENAAAILPFVYIAASSITVVFGVGYSWLESRISFDRLLTFNIIAVTLILFLFRILFDLTDELWPALVAVIGFDVIWVMTSLEFWGLAGRLFNVRQGKRLFGFIGTGEMLATILAGTMIPFLVSILNTVDLFYLAAGGMIASLFVMQFIVRVYVPHTIQQGHEDHSQKARTPREMLQDRYVIFIFLMAALAVMTLYFVDNAFYSQAEIEFQSDERLASFLGIFLAISGVAQFFSRAFLSGWLLSRFGVVVGLITLPFSLAVGAIAVVAAAQVFGALALVFGLVVLTKFFDKAFRYSINRAATLILYQPFALDERLWAQTASESIVEPISGIIAGIILLVLNATLGFDAVQLLAAMLVLLLAWMVIVVFLNREYIRVLVKALGKRTWTGAAISLEDSASLAVLTETLKSPRPGEVIYALRMLEKTNHESYPEFLLQLLSHSASEVRQEVLVKIEQHNIIAAQPKLIDLLINEPDTQIRSIVLRVLVAVDAVDVVLPYLDYPDSEVKMGAIVGLLRVGHGEGYENAQIALQDLMKSEQTGEREFAAQVIGEAGRGDLYAPLVVLLNDADAHVRRAAIVSAGMVRQRALWPLIIKCLSSHEGAMAAVNTLSMAGDTVIPQLISAFQKPRQSHHVLIRILRVMGRIRGPVVTNWLRERIDYPDEFVRYYLLDALRACEYQAENSHRTIIEKRIHQEIEDATWTLASLYDIQHANGDVGLLIRALQQELELARRRVLLLLSFLYDAKSLATVKDNLMHPLREKHAYAIEILDTSIAQELKPFVFPLMERQPPSQQLNTLKAYFPQEQLSYQERLKKIFGGDVVSVHPWTKACAIYSAAQYGDADLSDAVVMVLADTDPIVHETAIWALYQLAQGLYRLYATSVQDGEKIPATDATISTISSIDKEIRGEGKMLLTIEKVIILKTVSIFSETPEDLLAEIAMILEEVEVETGEDFIIKDELGDCMYIIVNGQVRVHDEGHTIAILGEREVVGELALLDSEPRNAYVSADEPTLLLKLHQEPFFELISNNPEVVRGIMRVLTRRLRASTR